MMSSEAHSLSKSIIFYTSNLFLTDDFSDLYIYSSNLLKHTMNIEEIMFVKINNENIVILNELWFDNVTLNSNTRDLMVEKISYEVIFSPFLEKHVFLYSIPLFSIDEQWGWLNISLSVEDMENEMNNSYYQVLFMFTLLLSISTFFPFLISMKLKNKIKKLINVLSLISKGNIKERIYIRGNDEIAEISFLFNTMMEKLEESQYKLTLYGNDLYHEVRKKTSELNSNNIKLQRLNKNLDSQVKLEIDKRLAQENILIEKSKIADTANMLAMIAHQWRQPLNALTIIIQNLHLRYVMDLLSPEIMKTKVEECLLIASSMSATINDFSDFFNQSDPMKLFLIHDVFRKLEMLTKDIFFKSGTILQINNPNNSRIMGYQNELNHVLLNLVINANDAYIENNILRNKRYIFINVVESKSFLSIYIEDNAGGIKYVNRKKIFFPYFSTKNNKNGTGLGLYMSKIIIEKKFKGTLSFNSNNQGSIFKIEVPI